MSFPLYSQRSSAWANDELGWGPPGATIGLYGCLETDFAMIASDSGHVLNPAQLNQLFIAKVEYVTCGGGDVDHDCLPDNALDLAFPGEYQTRHVTGFDAAGIGPAVNSPDTYVIMWISTASVTSHFVIAYSPDGLTIADPWTGSIGRLAGYGGPAAVHKTTYVKHLPPPPAPAPGPPVPVPTPPPALALYTFRTDALDAVLPADGVMTLESAIAQADAWSAKNPGTIYVNDANGNAVHVAPPYPVGPPQPTP